jgi:glycosyltransferase involved in cell wall biosynthesis
VLAGLIHVRADGSIGRQHRALVRSCDAYVAHTPYERERVLASCKIDRARTFCIPPPLTIDDGGSDGTRPEAPPSSGNCVIGYVGRLSSRKGLLTLIDAFERIAVDLPGVRLTLAGSRTTRTGLVHGRVAALPENAAARVRVVSDFAANEKSELYSSFDIFVNPSSSESFGMAVVEAWSVGLPVVAAAIPTVESVVRDGHDGLLFIPDDSEDLERVLRVLIESEPTRHRLTSNGRRRVAVDFSVEQCATRWDQAIATTLDATWLRSHS